MAASLRMPLSRKALGGRADTRWLLVVLTMAVALLCEAEEVGGRLSIPKSGNRIEDFVPPGYQIGARAEADFNGDGLTDVLMVIESEQHSDLRPLLVLFRRPRGGYTLSARADRAVPEYGTGGTHGDGFMGLEIHKNTFVILWSGGSSTVGEARYQFRYQDGGWFLIGEKEGAVGDLGRECAGVTLKEPDSFNEWHKDTNFLTGEQIESCWTEESEVVKQRRKVPREPLIRLEKFES